MTRLCECGCGQPTPIATRSRRSTGMVKGQALRVLHGHGLVAKARRPWVEGDHYIVEDCGYDSSCWVWQRGRFSNGYGIVRIDKRAMGAHRASFERANGEIPEGLELDHLCRNKACVNPDHLEAVTRSENVRRWHASKAA